MLDLDRLSELYNRCNPDEPVTPDDDRFVDLDAGADVSQLVRGERWAALIARRIDLAGDRASCVYFTGLRGSGKSTELRRLASILGRRPSRPWLVALVDAARFVDLSAPVDVSDILIAAVTGVERAVVAMERGCSVDDIALDQSMKENYGTRLWHWLKTTNVDFLKGEVAEGGAKLPVELKERPSFRQQVRTVIANHISSFVRQAHDELRRLEGRARVAGKRGVALVLDSLERLQGFSGNWEDVLTSAERVFGNDAPFLQLPVPVVYTVPPALVRRLRMDVQFLPMIKLRGRDGRLFAPGFAAAREIVRHRLPDSTVNELLGPTATEARIRVIIEESGGYPRALVQLLQRILEAEQPLTDVSVRRVVERSRDAYRRVVLDCAAVEWIARVAVEKQIRTETEAERRTADYLLSGNVILRYANDAEWYDLHPAVSDMEEVKRAIERIHNGANLA